jgi:ABC-2 type transport system ATP-binding protein
MSAAAVLLEGVSKRFGNVQAVDDLSLEVQAGEVFGFLGPNGAGKTTTIRMILDLIRPDAGRMRVLDGDPRADGAALRRRIGFLAGDLALWPRLTGRQVLDHLARLRGGVDPDFRGDIERRIGAQLDRPLGHLSRGNLQKIGVVQAFMARPDLIILDEPTTGLDPLTQDLVHSLVRQARDEGRSVFLSSHNMAEVQQLCDRVALIGQGRLMEVARVEDLRRRAVRRVDVFFERPVEPSTFEGVEGVEQVVRLGPRLHILVRGRMDALVKAISQHPVAELRSQEPSLEEIFKSYYRQEAAS